MTYRNFNDFLESLKRYDNRLALTMRTFIKIERTTYRDLRRSVYQTTHYLRSEGLVSGDRIMIIGPSSPRWVELFLGAQLIGITVVPVDAQSSIETVLGYAKQIEPRCIFKSTYLLPGLPRRYKTYALEQLDQYRADQIDTLPSYRAKSDEVALIVFTSGTTADPKGVVLTQRNILANVSGVQQALTIDPNWRLLSVLPLSHMYELTGGCLAPLSSGASIFYTPRVTPLAIVRSLREYHITTILAVPQLLVQFLGRIQQAAAAEGKEQSFQTALNLASMLPFPARRLLFRSVHTGLGGHLRMIVTGGAPIPLDIATAWERMGVKMIQGYGLTETAPILAVNNPNDRRLDSQGKPLDNIELRVDETTYEIQARGPSVFTRYWQNKPATQAAFTGDGWFKTGDIGDLKNGWLQVQGRTKFTITLSSGLKVMPEDVEVVADHYPQFKAICIVGVKEDSGEQVQAVVISDKTDEEITAAISQLNGQLESFQHISDWVRWPDEDFPRTRLLKTDRRYIQDWANAHARDKLAQPSGQKPSSSADSLVHILRLGLSTPNAHIAETDRLSDVGLDSLRRLTVVSLIEEQLGVSVAEADITQHTTLADLRRLVDGGTPAAVPAKRVTWTYWPLVRMLGDAVRETLVRGILRIWVAQHTEGSEHARSVRAPALYIFNHVDDFDAPVLYKALPWGVRRHVAIAMADDVLQEHKVLAFVARFGFGAFNFVRQEPVMPSLEYAAKLVDRGWNIAIAPEGTISMDGTLQTFKSGIGLLAVELGIPVVPVKTFGLTGTVPLHAKWPKKHSRVTVRIGAPIRFDHTTTYDDATAQLQAIMEKL